MQIHRRAPQTFTSDGEPITPSLSSPLPSTTCDSSSGSTHCEPIESSSVNVSSKAVWAVVIFALVAAVGLVIGLIIIRKRLKRRNRERIRGLLWELVRAVQDGRIPESQLHQALYGVDPGFMNPKTPVMYEVCIEDNTNSKGCKSLSKSVPLPQSSPAHWNKIVPFSMSHPEGVLPDLPAGRNEKINSVRPGSGKRPPRSKKALFNSIEQKVNVAVLVRMPRWRRESPTSDSSYSVREINPTTYHSAPYHFAIASPTFHDSVYEPVIPNKRLTGRPEDIDPVVAISLSQIVNNELNADHPLTLVGRNFATR
ncbi:hypothetical protein CPB86DRAFT_816045 [Serendipita vermifera]|nr:hypothetical protein CPB86DRAFT_816045 [Serendipita vermifera]